MGRILRTLAIALTIAGLSSATFAQINSANRGYVPRHERIAASILRRKAASGAAMRSTQHVAQSISTPEPLPAMPIPDVNVGSSELGPPSPPTASATGMPAMLPDAVPYQAPPVDAGYSDAGYSDATYSDSGYSDSGYSNSSVMGSGTIESAPYVESSSYPTSSYPITPHQEYLQPAPQVVYDNPFSTPIQPACGTVGCSGGPSCGCGVAPTCGAAGCDGGCAGGCGGLGGYGGHGGVHGSRWIDTFSLNLGVEGFKNGANRGDSGSFGFQEGINWSSPWVFAPLGMNTQLGFRATQSDFNGSNFTADQRSQVFLTAGFFKRKSHGWQGGFVFDYLHDDWTSAIDVAQIRGELSWAVPNGSSVGLDFATSVADDNTTSPVAGQTIDESWETQDYFRFFYRVQSNRQRFGQWKVFVGFTGESDGLVGTDFKIPLAGTWSLEPTFTYLVPDEATGQGGTQEESWNVAFNLVWYPGRSINGIDYSRLPLFDAADNGSMILRRN